MLSPGVYKCQLGESANAGSPACHRLFFVEKLGWQMLYDQDEKPYLYRDSENSSLTIPVFELGFNYTRRLVVQAKDADGNLTEAKTVIIEDQLIMG